MLVVLKTMHLFLASTGLLLLQPQAILGSASHRSLVGKPPPFPLGRDGSKEERYIIDPISEAYYAEGLDGRSSQDDPICVNVKKTLELGNDSCFSQSFDVIVQVDTPLKCRAKALNSNVGDYLGLSMYTEDWNNGGQYCSVGSQYGSTVECSIGLIMTIQVQIEFYGSSNSTTIEVTCTNDPCTAPVCGDGFCSAGLELPVTPLKKTNATCKEDCGYSCGDGICDADLGESEATCRRDCYPDPCIEFEEFVTLDFNETKEFRFEL